MNFEDNHPTVHSKPTLCMPHPLWVDAISIPNQPEIDQHGIEMANAAPAKESFRPGDFKLECK